MSRQCFGCGHDNAPEHTFCSECGSALLLRDYLAASTAKAVSESIRDRDILETESAIRVFERALGWAKTVAGLTVVMLTILGLNVWWKVSDWSKAVDSAKAAVTSSAQAAKRDIEGTSNQATEDIHQKSATAIEASTEAANKAVRASASVEKTSQVAKAELVSEASAVSRDAAATRAKLAEVDKLRPQFESMQGELSKATEQLADQQKVLESTENLAKHILSSHRSEMFIWGQTGNTSRIIVVPPSGNHKTLVYMLLDQPVIPGTIEIQWWVSYEPPGSFVSAHNLVIFSWGDPTGNLKQHQLSVSYFPDSTDKQVFHALSEHNGIVYADGIAIPPINTPAD